MIKLMLFAVALGLSPRPALTADDAQAQFNAGVLAFKAKDMARAEAALAKATALAPKDAEAWELYGTVLAAKGKGPQAQAALEKAVDLDAKRLGAWQLLAKVSAAAGDAAGLKRAAEAWGEAADLKPSDPRFATNQALVLAKLGEEGEAISLLEKAAKLPGGGQAWRALCALYNKKSDWAKAISACQGSLAEESRAQEWYNLGYAQQQLGKQADARLSLQRAVKDDPSHAASLYNLAFLDFEGGNAEKALTGFLAAAKAKGGVYPEAQYNAAVLLGDLGRYEDAAALYRALIKGGDQSADTAANLTAVIDAGSQALIDRGKDAFERGDLSSAKSAWDRALRLDPDNAQAKALSAQIAAQLQAQASKAAKTKADAQAQAKAQARAQVDKKLKEEDGKLLAQGLDAAARGDDSAAVRLLDFYVSKSPGNAKAQSALVQARARLRRSVDELLQQAGVALANGRREQALALAQKASALDPANARAASMAAQAGQAAPQAVDAAAVRKQYYQGVELYLKGDLDGAVGLWRQVLSQDPENLDAKRSITRAELELEALKKRGKG